MYTSAASLVAFRSVRLMLVACTLLAATATAAEPRWAELNRAAREALNAGDYPKLRTALAELAPLMPGNVRVAYNTAAAAAHLGDIPAAFAGLSALCNMGVVFDLASDADFDSLHGTPRYEAALACMKSNAQPVSHTHVLRTLEEADLLPEDIAYDPTSKQMFVSSIRKSKIIDSNGALFAATELPALALALDDARRTLWASIGWLPQCERCSANDKGKTALVAFDIDSRRMTRRIDSPVEGVLGDMTIGNTGEVYVSDGESGAVFHLAPDATQLERIDPPGEFASPQQPALSTDQTTLYVADYVRGIAAITLASRALTWLQPGADIALSGIDGLKIHGESFIAVQNGTRPARIVRISLDLKNFEVLEANWPGLGEPTHGTLIGNRYLFIANTGWPEYGDDGNKRDGSAPVVSSVYEIELEP
jgi:sugar lactone lactonase YvrE